MQNPKKSLISSIAIWSVLILLIAFPRESKLTKPQTFVEIEASLVGSASVQNQSKKNIRMFNQDGMQQKKQESKQSSARRVPKKVIPLAQPLPDIPENLKKAAFNSHAIARFYIGNNGLVKKVELIKPSDSPKLNSLLIKSLKKWQFTSFDGSGDLLVQDVKVSFAVE